MESRKNSINFREVVNFNFPQRDFSTVDENSIRVNGLVRLTFNSLYDERVHWNPPKKIKYFSTFIFPLAIVLAQMHETASSSGYSWRFHNVMRARSGLLNCRLVPAWSWKCCETMRCRDIELNACRFSSLLISFRLTQICRSIVRITRLRNEDSIFFQQ